MSSDKASDNPSSGMPENSNTTSSLTAKIQIRPARPEDRAAIVEMGMQVAAAGDSYHWYGANEEEQAEYWLDGESLQTFVATVDGAVAGMYWWKRKNTLLFDFCEFWCSRCAFGLIASASWCSLLLSVTAQGVYIVHPNKTGRGRHVGHCAYMVGVAFRGNRLGQLMCQHSLVEAKRAGFIAIQFNMVVSTNAAAVRSWQKSGFRIVGTLPKAYDHAKLGYVDAHVMYRLLDDVQIPDETDNSAVTPDRTL